MMPADARARMRDTLRAAVRQALLPGAVADHPGAIDIPREPLSGQLERFQAQLTALGGTVHALDSPDEIAELVVSLAAAERARQGLDSDGDPLDVLGWDASELPVPGVDAALTRRGVRLVTQAADGLSTLEYRQTLGRALVGVTGAQAGLAETGSIVVASGPGRPRLASLLPPIHVALLDRRLLVESLPDLIAARPDLMTAGANVVCITGPSRTADIEHTLTRGVHGPREIHVVLVPR